ncbi:MAG TPA: hypothetical protein VJ816_08370 [Gemmatimonadales bacterium]|nr:hypothetical protein [Gemmatimonadales bacterium]
MRFTYTLVPAWPPLAWLARCRAGQGTVDVLHGSRVEVNPDWFAEAVWADCYAAGDFDRTDLVFGSGGRLRNGTVTFVSSGTTVDRLQWWRSGSETWVSNSLPCLLMAANGVPDPADPGYFDLFKSITRGIKTYTRDLPTSAGPVRLVYFDNLVWDGGEAREAGKPTPTRDFRSFEKYRDFLISSLRQITDNLTAPERRFPYRWIGTMSSGYDSLASAVLAKPMGLDEAISFTDARGGDPDSGEAAAGILGVTLTLVPRNAWRQGQLPEVPFIASDAKGEDVFMRGAIDKLAGRVLLTGHRGGGVWDKNARGLSDDLARADQAGLSLTEFRLWAGFLHVPVPFFGGRQTLEITALNHAPEMRDWDVGGRYTRPLPRRIIESAGIPRGAFAVRKRAGSVLLFQRDSFLSPSALEDFTQWLRDQRIPTADRPGRRTLVQQVAAIAAPVLQGLSRMTGDRIRLLGAVGRKVGNIASREPLFRYLFPWAITRAKERYTPFRAPP